MVTKPDPTHHDPCGGILCLDFVNSIDRPARGVGRETLVTFEDLLVWSEQACCLAPSDVRRLRKVARDARTEAQAVLERAHELREAAFRAFAAIVHDKKPPAAALGRINREVATALGHAKVERRADGFAWAFERDDSLAAALRPIARSIADLLVSENLDRIKECASDSCRWLFLDTTKNRARRWCTMKNCGNLAKVRKHRRLRKSDGPPS